ncbi:MAG: hypothetical protein DYG90_09550 [Chloroflexi bacterium CFX6]|nr:hypothetical protein [Chloroflexi bacterium CFX6]
MSANHLQELQRIAAGRDYITTPEFALTFGRASQTVRKNYCLTGECFGIKPRKIAGRLLWPVAETSNLLDGGSEA